MIFEGPDPSEALPPGERPLLPEELGRVSGLLFRLDEIARTHIPDQIREEAMSPAQQKAVRNIQDKLFESIKRSVQEE